MKILMAACTALVAATAGPAWAQEGMPAAEIQRMLAGKRVSLACIDGTTGSGRYTMQKNSGTIRGTYVRSGATAIPDVGEVRAQGDSLCLRFKLLNNGEERCFGVSQIGPGQFNFSISGVNACKVAAR